MYSKLTIFIIVCFAATLIIDQTLYSYSCEMAKSAILPAYVIVKPIPKKPLVKVTGKNIAITVFPPKTHQTKNAKK